MSAPEPQNDRAARLQRAIEAKRSGLRRAGHDVPLRPAEEPARLGELQRGLWFVHRLDPGSAAYNLASTFRVHGPLDIARLQQALDVVVARHRLLRSTFRDDGDDVLQVVSANGAVAIERLAGDAGDCLAAATREAARPFDLAQGPLVRAALIEAPTGDERVLVLALHHILADERALELLWREIAGIYDGGVGGSVGPATQYDDYVYWTRDRDPGGREEDLAYWRVRLDPVPDELRLPFEQFSAPAKTGRTGRLIAATPGPSARAGLRRLAESLGITPFMASAFAFGLLLHRYTSGQRVAFGTPVSTRSHPAALEMFGYFLNPVAICVEIDEQQPVREAAVTFAREQARALAHAALPFDTLAAQLSPRRQADRQAIFQVMFVYQENGPAPALGQARLEPVTLDLGASKFDLSLFVTERAGALEMAVEYRADRFDEVWMRALLGHYERLLEQLPLDLDRPIADVPMLGTAEAARLSAWEQGPVLTEDMGAPVPELVLAQAQRRPQAPAVVCGDVVLDYGALETSARAITSTLIERGVRPGDRVAVFLERSVDMIAAVLGSQLAGTAYVPMDPTYPQSRNQQVLADAEVAAVLTSQSLRDRLPEGTWVTLAVDGLDAASLKSPPLPEASPDQRAYILYTSGSTGRPKGVVVTHENLRRSTLARFQVYEAAPQRFLLLPSLAFDSSVAGIFWTLVAGGTLVVPTDDDARDAGRLARLIEKEAVTDLLCVPSLYAQLLDGDVARLRALRRVIVAGESCSSRLVEDHFAALPHVRLFNEYGPTEATVWATVYEMRAEDAVRPVAIGRPIPGVRVEVRDPLGRQVPAGVPGRVAIAGPTVASGYWRREDLTAERFAPDDRSREHASRRYWTGDRMAWSADGRLLFLGREDEQIKLRGFRIEPGEIEAALLEHPHVSEAAVVVRPPGQLVAFVVAKDGGRIDGWRADLATRLPDHMIPARVVALGDLPRLPNGKIDRRRLLELPIAAEAQVGSSEVLTAREQALLSLWEGLLGRYGFSVVDNFFELGGHSLLVIQMVAAIERDFEVTLRAGDVFQHPTVRELSRRIEQHGGPQAHLYEQLFPIQPTGRRAPFVMASPDFFTEALAARFRGERPVYGVRGVSLRSEGNRGRWPTLTHLAEAIVGELQRRFPEGPYVIAGYSFGAWLGIEVARVLERRRLPVQRLYVIAPMPVDFVRAGPFRLRVDGLRQPLADLGTLDVVRHYLRSNHPLTRGPYRRGRQWLVERPYRRVVSVLGALRRRRGLPLTPRQMQADVRVERFRLHAAYRPGSVSAPTEFFNPVGPATDTAATWRPYFTGPLTVHSIPDPHDEVSVGVARDLILEQLRDLGD